MDHVTEILQICGFNPDVKLFIPRITLVKTLEKHVNILRMFLIQLCFVRRLILQLAEGTKFQHGV